MSDWVDVAPAGELGPNEHRVVDVDEVAVAVFNIDGKYYAVEDLCSHEEYPIADGDVEDGTITCPAHGAKFCLRTGAALSAPAYEGIATFPVRIEGGMIQVRDDRWD
ncbi:MAG: non-heme iron oxygenase ferredoxin subunit [Chromatiales bacterium]|jgi:3-phenylpropionate/trans-cinnamate dioxygenase ferredoxin subunit